MLLLKQGYGYHKIRKSFSKFYHRHSELVVKYNTELKTLLQQGISEPIFYGDTVYKFKRNIGKPNFRDQFKNIIKRYIKVGYNLDVMRQSACLILNPITVYIYGFLFNCTTVSGIILYDGSDVKLKSVGWCLMLISSWTHRGST